MTLAEIRKHFHEELASHYEQEELDAVYFFLLENRFGIKRLAFELDKHREAKEAHILIKDLARLYAGEPVQHIVGSAPFMGMDLCVSPAVLIPRPETEELVELVLGENNAVESKVLDIGTGSGCIPIALAKKRKDWQLFGLDVSVDALKIAAINAEKQAVNVRWLKEDISALPDCGQFDVIVSNPPYIPLEDAPTLEQHVLNHEPHLALFAPENDALFFYRAIKQFADKSLTKPGGRIYFETHFNLATAVAELFTEAAEVRVQNDMFGKQRFVVITY